MDTGRVFIANLSKGQLGTEPANLLGALLEEEQGIVRPLVQKIGANPMQLRTAVEAEIKRLPKVSGGDGQVSISLKCGWEPRTRSAQQRLAWRLLLL